MGLNLKELAFYYVKSPSHTEIKVDGAIGGPSPTGDNIAVSLYTERNPIPQVVVHSMTEMPDGSSKLGEEIAGRREGKSGVVRVVQATLHMNLDQAMAVHEWLGEQIKALEDLGRAR